MQFFYWNKSFEVGIPAIDFQHRSLVDLINTLAAVFVEGGRLPDVQALGGRLLEYATIHFHDEEQLMATCPLTKEEKAFHRKAHNSFVVKAQEILLRPDLLQEDVSQQVLEFLTTWLISHILGSDMKIAHSLAQNGTACERNEQQLFDISCRAPW